MCESIRQELRSYCLVFKSWKPRSKSDSLVLELELRYVSSSDFTLKSLTLEMERTAGGLTGESIQAWLEDALQKWDLPLATLSILTGDSRASLEEACKAMGIRHVPCVQLGLARIANALLLSTGEDDEENEAEEKEIPPSSFSRSGNYSVTFVPLQLIWNHQRRLGIGSVPEEKSFHSKLSVGHPLTT
ncbi:Putative LOC100573856 [Caligus rogercresseyi]|uniref:LOC100573856 n=1 Tax=Caligus rogercresseyi TaxID=217165 RepID=A0A7T8GWN7_CALRO|nr:Putative LOC100573856 [Caligus rogercresseyi]